MATNAISEKSVEKRLANLFEIIGQPTRLKILLVIGTEDGCVCHIKAVLGIRQAAISQHLMVLRDSGLVVTNRNGRNIFYRLSNPDLIAAIYQVASIVDLSISELEQLGAQPVSTCPCPRCNPNLDSEMTCEKIKEKNL